MNRGVGLLLCWCLALAGCTNFYGEPRLVFKDKNIEVFEKLKVSIDPHASGLLYAVVQGRQYDHVKGAKPFYVWLEKGQRLLLVTRNYHNAQPTGGKAWTVSLSTGEVKSASLGDSVFGTLLNSDNPAWKDEVASVMGDEVVLRSIRGSESREITVRLK